MDEVAYNRTAWNTSVERKNRWTIPVDTETIERARKGQFELVLTPVIPVPKHWYPDLKDTPTLCLASGGGQQGPILAAAGADVTVFDNSPKQLEQDRFVADRDGLTIKTVEGDMRDLSVFADAQFGLIFHPCSNVFVSDIRPVWRECYRVLRPGGVLLAGFTNPVRYIFDDERMENGNLEVRHALPYSDLRDLSEADRQKIVLDKQQPLEFGHTLGDQIGGQLDAGFLLTGFYEDKFEDAANDPISEYMCTFIATRAAKP
jgi:SAM-dependent methyltransferase